MLFLLHYYLLASQDKCSPPYFILRICSALLLDRKLTVSDLNCLKDGTLNSFPVRSSETQLSCKYLGTDGKF